MKKILVILMCLIPRIASGQDHLYPFYLGTDEGKVISLKQFEGKVLLIVNTATECGFTPQYKDLQTIYQRYRHLGFEILDVPCNQFGGQAPGSMDEIKSFCSAKYATTFPLFYKLEVNGENEHPLYKFLKSKMPFKGFDTSTAIGKRLDEMLRRKNPNYAQSADIKWNFTKFLIDRKGRAVQRFEPTEDMKTVEDAVKKLLAQ